jgi:hypothetical protein
LQGSKDHKVCLARQVNLVNLDHPDQLDQQALTRLYQDHLEQLDQRVRLDQQDLLRQYQDHQALPVLLARRVLLVLLGLPVLLVLLDQLVQRT